MSPHRHAAAVPQRFAPAFAVAAVLSGAWALGCAVYDPSLLGEGLNSATAGDAGQGGLPSNTSGGTTGGGSRNPGSGGSAGFYMGDSETGASGSLGNALGGSDGAGNTNGSGGSGEATGSTSGGSVFGVGGSTSMGGTISSGGAPSSGGTVSSGGTISSAGKTGLGGAPSSGGSSNLGGRTSAGGSTGSGGSTSSGGMKGTGGSPPVIQELAFGRSVTASSVQTGNEAAMGNDGDQATRWCAADATFPQWWRVDLGASHTLNSFSVMFEHSDRQYSYVIETSSDGNTYASSPTFNGTGATQGANFASNTVARFVRITVTSALPGVYPGGTYPTWACFFEMYIKGT